MIKKPELLCPAGDLERLKAAVDFGADAVYLAGEEFGMRTAAKNFSYDDLREGTKYAHERGVAVHVTCNTIPHNDEIARLPEHLCALADIGVDAIIASDFGTINLVKKYAPKQQLHISVQSGIVNYVTARAFCDMGADRLVLARELSLPEIAEIRAKTPKNVELESFVHGAMCVSFSARCLLSSYMTGRDANRGDCAQPCRWSYSLMEEKRPGEYLPVYENERGTYIFNSKDLCMIEYIPEIIDAGIDSLKIEGRMKTALYVACVARTYRKAIDDYLESEEKYRANMDWYRAEIAKCTYRQFTTGFYFGKPDENTQIYDSNTYVNEFVYLGTVESIDERGLAKFEQRNKFCVGDTIELMKRDGQNVETKVLAMYNEEGEVVESCPHSKQIIYVELSVKPEAHDIMRCYNALSE